MTPALTLGIDLGGTKLALALAETGRARDTGQCLLIARRRRATDATGDARYDVDRIAADAAALVAEAGRSLDEIECVGLSAPGPIDAARGVLVHPPNLPGWGDVPIRDWLAGALGRPVIVENDANAGALAEWRFGAARGVRDAVFLTMSTGVGAGLILDGRLYRGASGNAGELGHVPVEWEGEPCGCGRRGCLEAYVGGAAWSAHLQSAASDASAVAVRAGGRARIRPEHVVAAAGEGDAFALAQVTRFNRYLARGIAALTFVLAPQVVVLGTIPSAMGEALCFEPLRALVSELVWPILAHDLRIVPSALGEDRPYYAGVSAALRDAT